MFWLKYHTKIGIKWKQLQKKFLYLIAVVNRLIELRILKTRFLSDVERAGTIRDWMALS
jgi:hypothetical protein